MRKVLIFLLVTLFFNLKISAQTPAEIVSLIRKSQQLVETASYKMTRKDTLVTGDVRTITGQVKMRRDAEDSSFGFDFQAKEDGVDGQIVFNGNMGYETNDAQKVYDITTNPVKFKDLLYHAGGRIAVPDLMNLDTTGARAMEISSDQYFYYLTISYPDLNAYDVRMRYKKITIDKVKMLPVAVKQHQETLGKVQDLTWNIQDLLINVPSAEYPFANPDFLKTYTQKVRLVSPGHPAMNLRGKDAPQFMLKSFDGRVVSSSDFEGKVVLLDFWEVWCGPCVESMPKIQNLYEKFKSKGLLVYGIINDIKQLESSRKFVLRKPDIKFPMLVGNEDIKKSYFIDAVPQYVLIDRKGKISFLSLGYSGEIESEVTKALNQQ
jgi:peroxiredoxin